jgi:hypothetical protein
MNDDQLSLLSKTIAAHAREVAGKEWKDEHRPVLISILTHAGLGNLDEGMLHAAGQRGSDQSHRNRLARAISASPDKGANGGLGQ